jgi:hypothetical protein
MMVSVSVTTSFTNLSSCFCSIFYDRLKELNCERDISYRICTKSGAAYIVKISNAAEPEGVVDFQIKALTHIAEQDSDLRVPHMIDTKDDKPFEWIQSDNGDRHMIGLEFVTDRANKARAGKQTTQLIELMKEECVLVSEAGPKNVLKIRPNFCWEREHVDLFITTLDRCLSEL